MACPICDYRSHKTILEYYCDSFDDSYLYNSIIILQCKNCRHVYNNLHTGALEDLLKYYTKEHTKENQIGKAEREAQLDKFISPYINKHSRILYMELIDELTCFDDDTFDVVVLDQKLEHVIELNRVMKDVKRVLKKTGYCYIAVPDRDRYDDDIYWYIMREHIQHFNLNGLKRLANENGFEVVKYEKTESDMVGTLKLPNLAVLLKPAGKTYCFGIGREFLFLYSNSYLRNRDLILVDDTPEKQKKTFKGMKIHSSDVLKEASEHSFLIITATVHLEKLKAKALELDYKGEIIDI